MTLRLLLAGALALLGAAPPAAAQTPAAAAATTAPEAEERRVLVMLRLAPEHYRPSTDYGGGGYGDPTAAAARRRLAARIARDQGLTLVDNWPMPLIGIDCVIMIVPEGRSVEAAAETLSHVAGVAWSQPLHEYETQAASPSAPALNDRLFAAQPAAQQWKLAQLHRMATGKGETVAVIDSGVDASHPDLRGQVVLVRDFVGGGASGAELHGTGVAGIIGARANNGMGIAGVAPGARLMGLRACRQRARSGGTFCDTLSLARAMVFAIEQRVDVVNMSLTGPPDPLLTRLVQAGLARRTAIVAAVDPKTGAGYPASLPGVIAVAEDGVAATRAGVYTAPGRDVPTTEPGGRWYLVSGNSYAAAHVSGLIALMREVARKRARNFVSALSGGGEIDACATVRQAAARPLEACAAR